MVAGASKFNDRKNFPWTMGWQPTYRTEAMNLREVSVEGEAGAQRSRYFTRTTISARITDAGLKEGLGDKAKSMIVGEASFEMTEPTVDSQIVKLKSSGADVFFSFATPRFAAQAIKRTAELGWKPMYFQSKHRRRSAA